MTDAQAKAFPFNPFDVTEVWPKGDYPLIEVGYFELNQNPENVSAEVEQVAFSPANIVPGISFSPDKMKSWINWEKHPESRRSKAARLPDYEYG